MIEQTATILETKQLNKSYGSVVALEDVNLCFAEEKIYGVFGRNGAGKTTLLDIIASRIYADQGQVVCLGQNIVEQPQVVSDNCCYMPEKHYFPDRLKVKQILSHASQSFPHYDVAYAERLCRIFKLDKGKKYEQLSRGQQSALRIVIGLASQAAITIFDEPVLGLDAVARDRFYLELIEAFSQNPRLFIIATHLIEEAADLFNEAIILKNGQVLYQVPVDELLASLFYVSGKTAQVDEFTQNRHVLSTETVNGLKTAVIEGDLTTETHVPGLKFSTLTMQNLFIHLTNDDGDAEQSA